MKKHTNDTEKLIRDIFNVNKRNDKQRAELRNYAIGTGHGYTSGGVIERSGGDEQSNIQAD